MSLATETSTAEEKTVYSVCGLLQFSKHYAGQLIVSVLFGSARVFAHFGLRPSPWR